MDASEVNRGETEMELNKIYNEECLMGMNRIPDKSIDMVLCDLPYGTTKNEWDSVIDLDGLWLQYERIIKDNGAIVLTAQTPFDKVLGVSNLKLLKYEWIWDKKLATGHLNAKKMPLKKHENILVFYKNMPTYNPQMRKGIPYNKGFNGRVSSNYGQQRKVDNINPTGDRYPTSILEKSNANKQNIIHPTQKPVSLFEYIVKTYTNKGDTVLDNCMGSGTTAVACIKTGRNYIGFEMDEDYYNKSLERIEREISKPKSLWV